MSKALMDVSLSLLRQPWPGYWSYAWPWGIFWLAFAVLFWVGLLSLLIWAVRSISAPRRDHGEATRILKRRLASGEITQEEYERILRLLED
jgi:uncharacterized membrane protein